MEGEVHPETPKPSATDRTAGRGEHGAGRGDLILSSEVTSCGLVHKGARLKATSLLPVCYKGNSWQKKKFSKQLYQACLQTMKCLEVARCGKPGF